MSVIRLGKSIFAGASRESLSASCGTSPRPPLLRRTKPGSGFGRSGVVAFSPIPRGNAVSDRSKSDSEATVTVQAELSKSAFDALKELARRRGVDANTALQQAIATDKLISDHVGINDKLLIEKPDKTYSRVIFSK